MTTMSIIRGGRFLLPIALVVLGITPSAWAADADLDPLFDGDGIVVTDFAAQRAGSSDQESLITECWPSDKPMPPPSSKGCWPG